MSFNQQLAAFRKAKGISQENLAEVLGVSRQAVSKWETGETAPEMANLLALCKILDVSPNSLMGWEEESPEVPQMEEPGVQYTAPQKLPKKVTIIAVLCVCAALVAGIFIGSSLNSFNAPQSPLKDRENVGVLSFDYDFLPAEGGGELKLTFMPNVADEELTYEVIRLDSKGNSQSYPAKYKEGICIAYVETVNYEWVTYMLKVSDGSRFFHCPLFKVKDDNDNTYTHDELWDD